ncbi:helix-turn-helix domain-containing protein [Streptomyces sp. NBC_01477]|uniref:helix-turn-helix domain-containing protein n=1 Tax=Streptomyces sp. NBC_01477 TaxID=2976015 RepID=UPI003FCE602D
MADPTRNNGTDPRVMYGEELRIRREAAGLTQLALGEAVILSPSMIAHIEAGRRKPRLDDAKRLDQALGTDGFFVRMRRTLEDARFAHHFATMRELERLATVIQCYGSALIPGLLQTEAYATAVLRAGLPNPAAGNVEQRVAGRLERAQILEDPQKPAMWVLLDEHALRRCVGGPAVMAAQLRHVASCVRRGRLRFHVLPFSAGAHALLESMVVLMWFTDAPPLAYVEGLNTGRVLDDPAVVEACRVSFDLALGDSLSAAQSLALLEEVAEEYERHGAPPEQGPLA